jgi:hypothetical protein
MSLISRDGRDIAILVAPSERSHAFCATFRSSKLPSSICVIYLPMRGTSMRGTSRRMQSSTSPVLIWCGRFCTSIWTFVAPICCIATLLEYSSSSLLSRLLLRHRHHRVSRTGLHVLKFKYCLPCIYVLTRSSSRNFKGVPLIESHSGLRRHSHCSMSNIAHPLLYVSAQISPFQDLLIE